MFHILAGSILAFAVLNSIGFIVACLVGLVVAAAFWWLCNFFAGLWNRSFSLLWVHHVLCAMAAVWTIFFCIAFASVASASTYFDRIVSTWDTEMHAQLAATNRSVDTVLREFEASHPFLGDVVRAGGEKSDAAIPLPEAGSTIVGPIDEVAAALRQKLEEHVHWAIFRLRAILLLSFIIAQGGVFALTGLAANKDIRPRT